MQKSDAFHCKSSVRDRGLIGFFVENPHWPISAMEEITSSKLGSNPQPPTAAEENGLSLQS